jgi:hypothetical protein
VYLVSDLVQPRRGPADMQTRGASGYRAALTSSNFTVPGDTDCVSDDPAFNSMRSAVTARSRAIVRRTVQAPGKPLVLGAVSNTILFAVASCRMRQNACAVESNALVVESLTLLTFFSKPMLPFDTQIR